MITRFVSAAVALAAAFAMIIGLAPGTAQAGPKAPKPNTVTITGPKIDKITVTNSKQDQLFQLLLSEVSWMATATPQTSAPKAKNLGVKYVMAVQANGKVQQTYDLYPQAVGGPRAHRGAKQPSGKTTDGWFYGRLTMSESLRYAGVPLEKRADVMNGGIGAGYPERSAADDVDPVDTVNDAFAQLRQLFLLNGAILVVILFGLAGIAFLIRRKV
ncbi:hypothetical protein [Actinoplanes sp. NPDC049265]|uniref:hypothetical protein n=1 Tax=Actinoplanes sp. NPDC049265 TaxID=3363902 RepID=UPI00370FC80C